MSRCYFVKMLLYYFMDKVTSRHCMTRCYCNILTLHLNIADSTRCYFIHVFCSACNVVANSLFSLQILCSLCKVFAKETVQIEQDLAVFMSLNLAVFMRSCCIHDLVLCSLCKFFVLFANFLFSLQILCSLCKFFVLFAKSLPRRQCK